MRRFLPILLLLLLFIPTAQAQVSNLPLCSTAVHAAYKVTGPDGVQYATWHPQIDSFNGCRFDHEHGSSPSLFKPGVRFQANSGYWPLYGYSASKHGMTEGHAGFKGYAFERGGYKWYVTHHFGTGNALLAACTRHHTVDIAARDSGGTTVADIHLMMDFGKSVSTQSGTPLAPAPCPQQASDAAASNGVRQIPVLSDSNPSYEPWRIATTNEPSFLHPTLVFNTKDAQTACDYITCTASLPRSNNRGAFRFLVINSGFRIHSTAIYSNTFYTDPMGVEGRQATDVDAVKQYIQPNLDISLLPATCLPFDAQAYLYDCSGATNDELLFTRNPLVTGAN